MGFRVSLYAIFDRAPSLIHRDLGLEPNGETEDFPDSPIAGASTKAGTYILYVNDRDSFGEDVIRPITRSARVLACNVNETVMYSAVAEISEGREQWTVIHDANEGLLHLESHGDAPAIYSSIRDEKLAQQRTDGESVDHVFDVPVDLFVRLGGVRYDEDIESGDERPWQTLVPIAKPKKRWWPFSR